MAHRARQDDDIYKRLKTKKEYMEKKTARCKLLSQCITCKTLSQAKGKLKGDYEDALKKAKGLKGDLDFLEEDATALINMKSDRDSRLHGGKAEQPASQD